MDLHDGRSLDMAIWDTAGQERYRTLAPLYYRNASAAVVVFDVTSKESFDGSRVWVGDFQEHRPGACVMLVRDVNIAANACLPFRITACGVVIL